MSQSTEKRTRSLSNSVFYLFNLFVLAAGIAGIFGARTYAIETAQEAIPSVNAAIFLNVAVNILGVAIISLLARRLLYTPQERLADDLLEEIKDQHCELTRRLEPSQELADLSNDRRTTGIRRVMEHATHYDWLPFIEQASAQGESVTIAKLRINFWENTSYYRALETLLANGGTVTLVMPDPRCPAMWLRYLEEPTSSDKTSDMVPWESGLEELVRILKTFYDWKMRVMQEDPSKGKRIILKVAQNYPTQALYKFGQVILVFGYPYLERGFSSPTFVFDQPDTEVYKYLERCIGHVVDRAAFIDDVLMEDLLDKRKQGLLSDARVKNSRIEISFHKS